MDVENFERKIEKYFYDGGKVYTKNYFSKRKNIFIEKVRNPLTGYLIGVNTKKGKLIIKNSKFAESLRNKYSDKKDDKYEKDVYEEDNLKGICKICYTEDLLESGNAMAFVCGHVLCKRCLKDVKGKCVYNCKESKNTKPFKLFGLGLG